MYSSAPATPASTDERPTGVDRISPSPPSRQRRSESDPPDDAPQASKKLSYLGGSSFARQTSAPSFSPSPSYNQQEIMEELRQDFVPDEANDSISNLSIDSSSDSLRRKLRARSATDPSLDLGFGITRSSQITARKDGLAALSAGAGVSPPVNKSRARTGSRSSIMRSASSAAKGDFGHRKSSISSSRYTAGASSPDSSSLNSSINSGSRTGSIRHSSPKHSRATTLAPDPVVQPEPAPRGMAQRARSASISSNGSSIAGSSRNGSRKNSFNGGTGLGLMSMTSSTPGTPEERRDPFGMTPLGA